MKNIKKAVALILVLCIAVSLLVSCGKKPNLTAEKAGQLTSLEALRALRDVKRDNLIKEWGEPDVVEGESDIFYISGDRQIVISYGGRGSVSDVVIEPRA